MLFLKLVFTEHLIEDAVKIVAVLLGKGKNIPEFFHASGVNAEKGKGPGL